MSVMRDFSLEIDWTETIATLRCMRCRAKVFESAEPQFGPWEESSLSMEAMIADAAAHWAQCRFGPEFGQIIDLRNRS